MANNIATVSIPCCVVQQKNSPFVDNGQILPQLKNVPCREVDVDDVGYWCTPVNDNGIFTSLKFTPQTDEVGNAITAPDYLSFNTFRVRDKISNDFWYIVGTIADFYASCQTCCGVSFIPMPCTVPVVPVCQTICDSTNDAGDFISIFAAPSPDTGTYTGNGAFNGEALTQISAATVALLVAQMNIHWASVGSPPETLVWSNVGNEIIATGGSDGDEICIVITVA